MEWQARKLGELCEIALGRTPSRADASLWDEKRETGNVWLSIADLLSAEDNIVEDSKEYLSDKGAQLCKRVTKGTLLVSFKLTLGRLAFAGRDLFTNEAIAALTITDKRVISKEFLFYFLHYFDWIKAAESDVKLKGMTLNKAKLKEIEVRFPKSLAEQQRIVGILDEAFAGIAIARSRAEVNRQNARAIFEGHLQSVFARRGKEWVEKRLGDLFSFKNGRGFKKEEWSTKGLPIIRIQNLNDASASFNYFEGDYKSDIVVEPGDLLFSWSGTVGSSFGSHLWRGKTGLLNQHIFKVGISPSITKEYAYYGLRQITAAIEQSVNGAVGLVHITKEKLNDFTLPVPPLSEQVQIADRLDALERETQRLTTVYERKLVALASLQESMLHEAFIGNL